MGVKLALTEGEIDFLTSHPEALELLAIYHSWQETMADAQGATECADHHKEKREEYEILAEEAKGRVSLE